MSAKRLTANDKERLHDIIEWLGTDIESVMRSKGEKPDYRAWIDATVQAHVLLTGCKGHAPRMKA